MMPMPEPPDPPAEDDEIDDAARAALSLRLADAPLARMRARLANAIEPCASPDRLPDEAAEGGRTSKETSSCEPTSRPRSPDSR